MKPIRASDIGSYLFCARAWSYRLQGIEPANQAELAAGSELHQRHGRRVLASGLMRTVALLALLLALVMLVSFCTTKLLP